MTKMIESITFKTELGEILTVEEVAMLFDNISSKYATSLVSLSLFPKFYKLRNETLEKTKRQRDAELSKLLTEISIRKREAKVSIWQVLGAMGSNKKRQQEMYGKNVDLEQIIYEEEQIINAYEQSIKSLEIKEKKIMSGKYQRVDISSSNNKIKSLTKNLKNLKQRILDLSNKHDRCFDDLIEQLDSLIEESIITAKSFPKRKANLSKEAYTITTKKNGNVKVENIDYVFDSDDKQMHYTRNQVSKDFYQYEPTAEDADDELIYQLLSQGDYDEDDGTVNGLLIDFEEPEYEN